jgi:regulatory protein
VAVVTDIKKQKRRDARYNIYLDGEYAFALSDLDLSTSGIRVGQTLGPHDVEQFKNDADQAKAYALAVRFIGVRPRSTREVVDYLRRKGFEGGEADVAVERLESSGLLNDRVFAESWVTNRNALRPRSRRMLAQELLAKGVASDVVQPVLDAMMGQDDEARVAAQVVRKKRKLPGYQDERKLTEYLLRQGFSYEAIKKALGSQGDT